MEKEIELIDISNRGMSKEEREKLQQQQLAALRKLAAKKRKEELVIQRKDAARQRSTAFKKNLRRGGIASVTGLSILLAGLFQSPSDLIQQQTLDQLANPPAVEIMLEEDTINDDDSKKKVEAAPVRKGFFERAKDALRAFFLQLPLFVRTLVCIPLWAAGYAIIHLVSLLIPVTLQPLLHHIISWLFIALVLFAVFAVTMKCLFPHMPWRKILRKRNLLIVLAASLILKAADLILPLLWPDYQNYKYPVMLICGIVLLLLIFAVLIRRHKKRKPA